MKLLCMIIEQSKRHRGASVSRVSEASASSARTRSAVVSTPPSNPIFDITASLSVMCVADAASAATVAAEIAFFISNKFPGRFSTAAWCGNENFFRRASAASTSAIFLNLAAERSAQGLRNLRRSGRNRYNKKRMGAHL